jgi:hypothetical protein
MAKKAKPAKRAPGKPTADKVSDRSKQKGGGHRDDEAAKGATLAVRANLFGLQFERDAEFYGHKQVQFGTDSDCGFRRFGRYRYESAELSDMGRIAVKSHPKPAFCRFFTIKISSPIRWFGGASKRLTMTR